MQILRESEAKGADIPKDKQVPTATKGQQTSHGRVDSNNSDGDNQKSTSSSVAWRREPIASQKSTDP